MSIQGIGPGKTAPKLLQDLLESDPTKSYVPVIEQAPTFEPGQGRQILPKGACKHEYSVKVRQSVLPPLDLRPDGTTVYKVAAVCKKCRLHIDVKIDYAHSTNVCPNSEFPLHHFQRVKDLEQSGPQLLRYGLKCSAPECGAILTVAFKPKKLQDEDVSLLTDEELLNGRFEVLMKNDPQREGMRKATQVDALHRLRRYIKDSLNPDHSKPSFPAHNKRFQEAFGEKGEDCHELLERLGFKYAATEESQDNWFLPRPAITANPIEPDPHRALLEDVDAELLALIINTAATTQLINPDAGEGWSSANKDLERTLAAQGYTRTISLRRSTATSEEQPYFSSLGALPDFADSMVEFAYDRQAYCDPELQDYYFECLQEIAKARDTENLQTTVAMLASQGRVSRRELRDAYKFFNTSPEEAKLLNDDTILGRYRSQLADMSPGMADQGRRQLAKIGQARGSNLLVSAARESLETYDEALSWLGAEHGMVDDFIISMYAIKVGESESNVALARKAVSIIAKARKSNDLNNWLVTGSTSGTSMEVAEACRYLNIEHGLSSVDPELLLAIFDNARKDRPGENIEKAISAIESAIQGTKGGVSHSPDTWPVGLTSHGNTCYLNSLLQYYFSIKPLRDIVLDYDSYKLDTSKHMEKQERVGHREITNVEIKGGQKFAQDLRVLFERMIKDPGTTVKPESDLVCRAFLDPKDSDLQEEPAAETNGQDGAHNSTTADAAASPADSIMADASDAAKPPSLIAPQTGSRKDSDTSSATLLDAEEADIPMESVEMPPTPPASPGAKAVDSKPEPTHAPPLPPRVGATAEKKQTPLEKAQENARSQQDVTEVHDGILFRVRAGLQPRGADDDNEQIDPLNDLFVYGYNETTVTKGQVSKPKPSVNTNVQLNVPYEATDIYSALDAVFDLQPMQEDDSIEKYQSLTSLPPFLQINIPRIGYDKVQNRAFKVDASVRLEDELYLDRYCEDSNSTTLERRKTCWGWRKQLNALNMAKRAMTDTGLDIDGPTILRESANYLSHLASVNDALTSVDVLPLDLEPDLAAALNVEAEQQAASLSHINEQLSSLQQQIDAQFQDLKEMKYRLHAVFFHRGGYGHGHYWLYIHDFTNNVWRVYNDEKVEEFSKLEDIFEAKTGQQGTPTYAVYVKDDLKEKYVQPVCRVVEKAPTPEPIQALEDWQDVTKDVRMLDRVDESQRLQGTVDPTTVMEGGGDGWDVPRSVVEAKCLGTGDISMEISSSSGLPADPVPQVCLKGNEPDTKEQIAALAKAIADKRAEILEHSLKYWLFNFHRSDM